MSLAQGPLPGFVCAVADSRVWGTKMAPTKKLGDGRSTGLRQSPLVGLHNNQQNDGVGGRGGIGEETQLWRNMWGGRLLVILGSELRVGKIENRESNGALDLIASAGWEDATTNQKLAKTMEYILGRRRAWQ